MRHHFVLSTVVHAAKRSKGSKLSPQLWRVRQKSARLCVIAITSASPVRMAAVPGLLVKVQGDGKAFAAAATKSFGAASIAIEPILRIPAQKAAAAQDFAARRPATWLRVQIAKANTGNAWDDAHALLAQGQPFSSAGAQGIQAIEPDIEQNWPYQAHPTAGKGMAAAADEKELCAFYDQESEGGKVRGPGLAWNLGDTFSELAKARAKVGDKLTQIIIAHLDTGFDPKHVTLPAKLRTELQRNFVKDDGKPNDASDQTPPGMKLIRTRGHGTGTLSLLAGNKLNGTSPNWPGFTDYVGGAPLAQIIPVRIANWVARFSTGTMVQGFGYAREKGAHVLSMSMGGLASQALVDAVNLAYEAGVVMVSAAGNNYADIPSPKSIVFPARLRRVLAACGVMADGRPYAGLKPGTMQGNFGPASKMETALGAYTPNVPWAQIDCGNVVDMDGGGTSAATPQIAAAAALWLAEHWDRVSQYSQPWMRVEAVRLALFEAARKSTGHMSKEETREKIGQGLMRADAALAIKPRPESELQKLPPAEASWSWLNMLVGGGVSLAPDASSQRRAMLALELTQMAQRVREVDEAIDDLDWPADRASEAERREHIKTYLEAVLTQGNPSKPLRAWLESQLSTQGSIADVAEPPRPAKLWTIKRKVKKPPLPCRRLRVYALDPSVAKNLATLSVNETTLTIPWDDKPDPEARDDLLPGPVGEYLEVVDVDPASNKVYDPVDLNDKVLLAQDGWPPSEGNPQFHQQMVYAVAMTTIGHFEQALGRRALWAPHYGKDGNGVEDGGLTEHEVRRLRIYPHALRADNAYYSPDKKALLFGYFPADSRETDATAPGSMVFSCLSSDIIAHEMSHALLDGLHRRFQDASNPDVPAFHEAFADIVALFQHFTVTELVRFEMGRARGDLRTAQLLAGLAAQFGEAVGRGDALRDYLSPEIRKLKYADTADTHDRGSILVLAVYDAFISIVERRTEDLIRLATSGTGVLPSGALLPDLVNRLTDETCKTAKQVLHMCIRALDYCPGVDITFSDYLRALITADIDLIPNDRHGYRVAFMEAFRHRGILPPEARTISEETLAWNTPEEPSPPWLERMLKALNFSWDRHLDRSQIFYLNKRNSRIAHGILHEVFADEARNKNLAEDQKTYKQFGLKADVPRFGEDGNPLKMIPKGETTFDVFSIRPARRVAPDGSFRTDLIATIHQRRPEPIDGNDIAQGWFWFRGGATLIVDPRPPGGKPEIRYIIVKSSESEVRLNRQRQAQGGFFSPPRALYFGGKAGLRAMAAEPFAMMHTSRREWDDGWTKE